MDSVEQICDQLGAGDRVKAYQARRALADRCAGSEADRAALATELAACLVAKKEPPKDKKEEDQPPRYSAEVRNLICRTLAEVGSDAQVPAIVAVLSDFETREMARFALDRMQSQATTAALIEVLKDVIGAEFRVGVVNALARRNDAEAREALRKATGETDRETRMAAAEALALQADAASDVIIVGIGKELGATNPRAAKRMQIARLQLAATLAAAGQKDAARGIYQAIASDGAHETQQKAARAALGQLG